MWGVLELHDVLSLQKKFYKNLIVSKNFPNFVRQSEDEDGCKGSYFGGS